MVVSNTLLLKQAEPMLKTNGSYAAREQYSVDAGSIVIIPSRLYTNRVPLGIAKYKIHYRFAGVHQPGVALPPRLETRPSNVTDAPMLLDTTRVVPPSR